jgi:hypothetical protein
LLAAFLLIGAALVADPKKQGIWLAISGGFALGLVIGVGWWLWVSRHGLRIPDGRMRMTLLGIGLIGATAIRVMLPEWALPIVIAAISGLTLVTAFPPRDAIPK